MDIFSRYAPFIRDFIYENGWDELRAVQIEAAEAIFDGDGDLLICSSTASGKTEAAFFPILTELCEKPSASFGVLYIAPLKALINDQYSRMEMLLRMSDLPLFHWHGDVAQSHKAKALREPRGILQITPESLESMLMNRPNDIPRLFSDLRYVVIDELHSVMSSDRGRQISCQLARVDRLLGFHPRRVGLSATVGDKAAAAAFLSAGSGHSVTVTSSDEDRPTWRLGMAHFFIGNDRAEQSVQNPAVVEVKTANADTPGASARAEMTAGEGKAAFDAGFEYLYAASAGKSCLLFSNSREETEYVTATLRQIAERRGEEDRFLIHHGNLSAALREETEHKLKEGSLEGRHYTACATVTLELGIDIGQLERILHYGAPTSVSGFLQRLGRSGRRSEPPEMLMVFREEIPLPSAPLPELLPFDMLRGIAVVRLYSEERFIEPASGKNLPLSLLFQETLSMLHSDGERTPAALAERVLSMPPFANVPREIYRDLLRSMIEQDHLQVTEEGGLIVGLAGEKLTNSFKFYASFKDSEDFTVRCGSDEIGTITSTPPIGDRFALAGRVWEVEELDIPRRLVFVHGVKGKMEIAWPGDAGEVHTRILERMRQVLIEDTEYPFLLPNAAERLAAARRLARATGVTKKYLIRIGGDSYALFPWLGTRAFRTLRRMLQKYAGRFGIADIEYAGCYYMTFRLTGRGMDENTLLPALLAAVTEAGEPVDPRTLLGESEAPAFDKYDPLIPPPLLREAFAADRLDTVTAVARLREMAK